MAIFDRLFRGSDPSGKWDAEPGWPLSFDFDRLALNRVPLLGPVDGLSRLGPAENPWEARKGRLLYYTRGVAVHVEEALVSSFLLVWRDAGAEGYAPYRGVVTARGGEIAPDGRTRRAEIEAALGAPSGVDEDPDETILVYETRAGSCDVELTPDGFLAALYAHRPSGTVR